jgi:hypothetical protein
MKITLVIGALLAVVVAAAPARADHNTPPAPADDAKVEVSLRLGLNGFRLGSRLFGREGYAGGAWLNGETRPDGFSLDGRVEREGRSWNFKLNADLDEWLRHAMRWWGGVTNL